MALLQQQQQHAATPAQQQPPQQQQQPLCAVPAGLLALLASLCDRHRMAVTSLLMTTAPLSLPGLLQQYYHTKLHELCDAIQQLQEQHMSGARAAQQQQQQRVCVCVCFATTACKPYISAELRVALHPHMRVKPRKGVDINVSHVRMVCFMAQYVGAASGSIVSSRAAALVSAAGQVVPCKHMHTHIHTSASTCHAHP